MPHNCSQGYISCLIIVLCRAGSIHTYAIDCHRSLLVFFGLFTILLSFLNIARETRNKRKRIEPFCILLLLLESSSDHEMGQTKSLAIVDTLVVSFFVYTRYDMKGRQVH